MVRVRVKQHGDAVRRLPPWSLRKECGSGDCRRAQSEVALAVAEHKSSDFALNDITATWTECTPETAKRFSAVAYFFGREVAAKENVPVGLIDSTWGGTPADSWVSLDTLGTNPALLPAFASRASFADTQADVDAQIAAEKREDAEAKAAGKAAPSHQWHPYETSLLPAGLYNGMVAPFTPLTIKGFLWYQGDMYRSQASTLPEKNGVWYASSSGVRCRWQILPWQ